LFGPLCFWTVACVFGVLPKQLAHISGSYAVEQGDMVTEGDVVGFAEEDTFQRKRHRRFRKVLAWLALPATALALPIATVLLQVALDLMGILFKEGELVNQRTLAAVFSNSNSWPKYQPRLKCVGCLLVQGTWPYF
jgi:hypothetical protein